MASERSASVGAGSKSSQPGAGAVTGDKASVWARPQRSVVGQWAVICLLMLAPGALWSLALALNWSAPHRLQPGDNAPRFSATPLRHGLRSISPSYNAPLTVVNIWATWCPNCRDELPILDALDKRLGPAGVRVMAVSVDGRGTEETILRYGNQLGLRLDLMHDPSGEIVRSFQAIGIPTTAVVDSDGHLIRIMRGANDVLDGSLERLLDSLIQRPPSTHRLLR